MLTTRSSGPLLGMAIVRWCVSTHAWRRYEGLEIRTTLKRGVNPSIPWLGGT
jgi:hypothetical protein